MATSYAISLRAVARNMLNDGFELEQVNHFINNAKKVCDNSYIMSGDIPTNPKTYEGRDEIK